MKEKFTEVKRPMRIMLIIVGTLFGIIFIYKGVTGWLLHRALSRIENIVTVTSTTVDYSNWQPEIKAVGNLRAILGVNVTAQLAAMIQKVYFTPGSVVEEGTVLVQQNADPNIGQLHSLEANEKLAEITYERDLLQYKAKGISKQQLDSDDQNLKSLRAQVAQQAAIVQQLTITAPFTGQLGVSNVYPGQYLNPGDVVTTLQSLDPIYVDFYLPQNTLSQLKVKQIVNFTIDAYPHQTFTSKITTINPVVDKDSRNIKVEATATNTQHKLLPGMFVNVAVQTGNPQPYLTVPQSAISFNPYGSISYVIKDQGNDKSGKPILVANQVFVITGEARGDQITVQQGLKKGDVIVTSGQLKLKNGSLVAINNSTQLANNPSPDLSNDHGG
ncbi:MAG: efflux transporter periplasmic adaptor subunit [Gammaproteobacteria bacterium RIFCSPHIGHO2_12_FULL_37_14]|nr:MAG: efflux transporter periplasmic adaptor subunit [Gammaproteobacteria bacterium RIFCSPHIGHO2_12_FULL_37_14]